MVPWCTKSKGWRFKSSKKEVNIDFKKLNSCQTLAILFSTSLQFDLVLLIWDKVFKKEPSKICGKQPLKNLKGLKADHTPSIFLKAVFHKFCLDHSWIFCPYLWSTKWEWCDNDKAIPLYGADEIRRFFWFHWLFQNNRLSQTFAFSKVLFIWQWAVPVRRAGSPRWDITFLKKLR